MKRFPILFTTLLVFLLSACSPAVQRFVELPDGTKGTITALVLAIVGFVLAKLITLVPFLKFLEDFRYPISMALAAALIEALQNALPSAYPEVSILAVQLILAVLAALKVFEILRARGVRFLK